MQQAHVARAARAPRTRGKRPRRRQPAADRRAPATPSAALAPRPATQVVILYASVSADHVAKGRTDDLQRLFDTKGVPYSLLDGTQDANRELRNALFAVSGKRAVYPQAFLKAPPPAAGGAPSFTFAGLAEEIQELADEDARTGGFAARFGALMRKTGGGAHNAVSYVDAGSVGVSAEQALAGAPAQAPVAAAPPPAPAPAAPPPPPAAPPSVPHPAAPPASAAAAAPPPAKAWHRHVDRRTGDPYWWCPATRESAWVDPAVAAVAPDSDWVALVDEKRGGRTYYYSWRTGASSWTPPPGFQH